MRETLRNTFVNGVRMAATAVLDGLFDICARTLLHMCPHTDTCVRTLLYMCPHTTAYVSSGGACWALRCVRILLYMTT